MKPDDSGLDPESLIAVESRARKLLDRADAWDRFPTAIDDILAAAQLRVAPTSIFNRAAILEYLKGKSIDAARYLKSAVSKIFGLYDSYESVIHIDDNVSAAKQNFLKLHETGHHELPVHRKAFRMFEDCEKTLSADIADHFEREANNFARFMLFQGSTYRRMAADCKFEIKTPINLARKFGASVYASAREFARTNSRACVVYVLEPVEFIQGSGAMARVRRIEPSPAFAAQFGIPRDPIITLDHALGRILPIGRRMTRPTIVLLTDRNGDAHECVAEALDTTHNIVLLLYPVRALSAAATIILPAAG